MMRMRLETVAARSSGASVATKVHGRSTSGSVIGARTLVRRGARVTRVPGDTKRSLDLERFGGLESALHRRLHKGNRPR